VKKAIKIIAGAASFFFALIAITALLRLFVFEFATVRGPSMEPALYTNEIVFIEKISKLYSLPKMEDIVVCDFPHTEEAAIKRVMGLPGDKVAIIDGKFYLNGALYENDVFKDKMRYDMEEIIIPEDHVFVMGDNRNSSTDSRAVGPVRRSDIVGKMVK